MTEEIRINSSPLINAPGFFRWLQAVYAGDKSLAIMMLMDCSNGLINSEGARQLLSGQIEVVQNGDAITFNLEDRFINQRR